MGLVRRSRMDARKLTGLAGILVISITAVLALWSFVDGILVGAPDSLLATLATLAVTVLFVAGAAAQGVGSSRGVETSYW